MSTASSSVPDDETHSQTSTLKYDQEPFETFVAKARALIVREVAENHHLGYRKGFQDDDLTMARMGGGSYNRLIGFSIYKAELQIEDKFVLRIPRSSKRLLIDDMAPLIFLRQHTTIPVPDIIKFDCTDRSEICSPWMIQTKVEGDTILYEWPAMNHEARCAAAEQLGVVYRQCLEVTSNRIGRIVPSNKFAHLVPTDTYHMGEPWTFNIAPINHALREGEIEPGHDPRVEPYSDVTSGLTIVEMLAAIFKSRCDTAIAQDDTFAEEYNEKFLNTLHEMDSLGIFGDMPLTLCHTDFEVRNIMADASNTEKPITAVLDWDEAVFAPAILACRPPMWIWGWKEDEDEDEREANDTPEDPEDCELKAIFERAAGPVYKKFAYGTANRLARFLVRIALFGMHSSDLFREAEDMLKEWSGLKSDLVSRCA